MKVSMKQLEVDQEYVAVCQLKALSSVLSCVETLCLIFYR